MDITVIGPGSVGTLIGGLLSMKGHRVTLRGRQQPARSACSIRIVLPDRWLVADGVRLEGPEDPVQEADAIFVTLGRHHLHAVRRPDFQRLIGTTDSPVAFFNCDPVEVERLAVPAERTLFCVTLMNAIKLQDADVELSSASPTLIYQKSPVLGRSAGRDGFWIQGYPPWKTRGRTPTRSSSPSSCSFPSRCATPRRGISFLPAGPGACHEHSTGGVCGAGKGRHAPGSPADHGSA